MARIRTIKPEFWKHEALCEQPEGVHMFAAALLNYVDDFGYFNANAKLIEAELYPLRKPSVKIPECLRRLQEVGYIRLGNGPDGRQYGQIIHFSDHQRVSHPARSKIEEISITWDALRNPPEDFQSPPESLRPERKGTGNREQGKEQGTRGALTRFDDFWAACPKKVGRGKAEQSYRKASKTVSEEILIAAMQRYARSRIDQDPTFTKHPATWLNQQCWDDEPDGARAPPRQTAFNSPEEQEAQRKAIEAAYGSQASKRYP